MSYNSNPRSTIRLRSTPKSRSRSRSRSKGKLSTKLGLTLDIPENDYKETSPSKIADDLFKELENEGFKLKIVTDEQGFRNYKLIPSEKIIDKSRRNPFSRGNISIRKGGKNKTKKRKTKKNKNKI